MMSFFELIDEKFFNPFCCRNREIYIACIDRLIEKSKEISVLYETDARNTLILYLRNCEYTIETEDIGEEIGSGKSPQENASAILRYFRMCGWITPKEIGRSGDNIASVSAYCRKLIDAIHKIFDRDANATITNHIFSMYEILQSSFGKESARLIRPYQNILVPLVENECDLKNDLLILKDSIREIMRAVLKMADANSFGQFLIKDELLNRFFNDYFFIKKSGMIPSYIAGIDRMLRKLHRSEIYDRMIEDCRQIENLEEIRVKEKINHQFAELDSFINLEYEQEMDYIDRKINTYYNLYSTRMMMVVSNNTNLEHELNRLLIFMKNLDDEDREEVLCHLSETHRLMHIGYIGKKSFERRKKSKANQKIAGLSVSRLSEEERQHLTEQLLSGTPDKYSIENVQRHFERLMEDRKNIRIEESGIRTRNDAIMFAASIIYSGAEGFPYEVELGDGMVETEVARIRKVTVKRREQ